MRILYIKEHDRWIGQLLEHDICVQSRYENRIYKMIEVAIKAESKDGLDRIGPAPRMYETMWNETEADAISLPGGTYTVKIYKERNNDK